MSQMQPRQVNSSSMAHRISDAASVHNFAYDEGGVGYEQQFVTYEYFDQRGDLAPRNVASATMKGR